MGVKFRLDRGHKGNTIIFRLGFGVKKIIDSLLFLFLLTHIGPNVNKKCLNDRVNPENLDLSHFF